MSIVELFPTLLYIENLNSIFGQYNETYYKKALEYRDIYPCKRKWACYTTIESVNIFNEELFKRIINTCTEKVQVYSKYYNNTRNVVCQEAWININKPGDSQEFHIHPNVVFSAIYYIKTNENSGMIEFMKPSGFSEETAIFEYKYNKYSSIRENYNPSEGDLIIFRSNLPHRVMINRSDENRASLAMNFILE